MKKTLITILSGALAGCSTSVPRFDIPVDNLNRPTIGTITDRIKCELGEVAIGYGPNNFIVETNAQVAVQLSLDHNGAGGLTPTFTYTNLPFSFTGGVTLSQAREQNFNATLNYSMANIADEFSNPRRIDQCKIGYANLEGRLGIKEAFELASTTNDLNYASAAAGTNGVFGGFVQFIVTKRLEAGPNWALTYISGPGKLASISEINTDKIVYGIAFPTLQEKAKGKEGIAQTQQRAIQKIQEININQLTVQLGAIRFSLQ